MEAFQTVVEEHLLANECVVIGGDVLDCLLPAAGGHMALLQVSQRRSGGLAAGVAADHAAALLPAALALDLVGGSAVLGHAPGHADAAAVAAEELPVLQPRGFGDGLDPPGDLGLRPPEHFLLAGHAGRPDGGKRVHGGGSDGHHRALGLGVGLRTDLR